MGAEGYEEGVTKITIWSDLAHVAGSCKCILNFFSLYVVRLLTNCRLSGSLVGELEAVGSLVDALQAVNSQFQKVRFFAETNK